MKKLLRSLAATTALLGASLTPGLAGAATNATIGTTGSGSTNTVVSRDSRMLDIRNTNTVRATVNNPQTAVSGDVTVADNTVAEGGQAESGAAVNDSFVSGTFTVDNSSCSTCNGAGSGAGSVGNHTATIDTTGSNSVNRIRFESDHNVTVRNNNNLELTTNNTQKATSGAVNVRDNTIVDGGARSGDAENISTTVIDFQVSN